ncbi:MAG: SUMF1/EgtB/PvdO family nonheme iron enzyme, partial [Planctomycetota bacterium]
NHTQTADVEMLEGVLTTIAIDTEQTSHTRLYWSWDGQEKVLVPSEALWHSAENENMAKAYLTWMPGRKGRGGADSKGDYDEEPRHKVTITQPFYMSETEVTISQFRQFRAEYPGYEEFKPYACSISWDEAAAFCKWLSEKEGRPYRLPTEAEWEYACRAGTTTPYSSGIKIPEHETANRWGVKNMHTGVREWCSDWYAVYSEQDQVDPVGPAHGWFKVVRGGNLDWTKEGAPYYARSANRGALAPSFGPPPLEYQFKQLQNAELTFNLPQQVMEESHRQYKIERLDDTDVTLDEALNTPFRYTGLAGRWSIRTSGFIPGRHKIGFRVVQAPMPKTAASFEPPFVHRCVKQKAPRIEQGPAPDKPYYRTRLLYPNFSGASLVEAWQLGIEQGYGGGHHNSALEVLANGDLLAGYYNTIFGGERGACVSIMSVRFRRGADEWDMPSSWPDNVDCDDEGPVFWNDDGTLWLFWGSPRQFAGYPFQYVKSTDNGATWSPVQFPLFDKRVGPYAAQPINSAFRDSKGTVYLAVDGSHSPITSELFATANDGKTWYDTGGRTYGRHSTFIALKDDVIMAFAGKQAEINGFHPINLSRDGGRTYEIFPSTLPALGGGTRASLIKLASGRLFYVGDMHLNSYRKLTPEQAPPGFEGEGAYAALSDDMGKTWRVRKLTGGNVRDKDGKPVRVHTVSYVTARQGPDGIIHLVTSHNHPDLHFELNEAWILQDPADAAPPAGRDDTRTVSGAVKKYSETYPNGQVKVTWGAGVDQEGRYVLHGTETWYYENGQKQWQAEYSAGRRVGAETYWARDGKRQWKKMVNYDGTYHWTVWRPDGKVRGKSTWRGKKLLTHKINNP